MAINLADVGSGYKRTAINNNFQSIEDEINNNLLSKNGGVGLEADLDANSQKIINLEDGLLASDAVNLAQLQGAISAAGSGLIASQTEVQYGSDAVGNVFTFTGITYTVGGNNLYVFRNGQKLGRVEDYTETSTSSITLTFSPNANDRFEFVTNIATTNSATTTSAVVHTESGTDYNLATYLQNRHVVNVKDFGAIPSTDSTSAIQAAFDSGAKTVVISDDYLIDAVDPNYPTSKYNGGVKPADNTTIIFLNNAKLTAIDNDKGEYVVMNLAGTTNVKIIDGDIVGDLDGHTDTGGEFGFGYYMNATTNPMLERCKASKCWGDGFYVGDSAGGSPTTSGYLSNCIADDNRRQGLSIVSWRHGLVIGGEYKNTGQTLSAEPAFGIDIEPNPADNEIDVQLIGVRTSNNAKGGIQCVPGFLSNAAGAGNPYRVQIIGHSSFRDGTNGGLRFANPALTDSHLDLTQEVNGEIIVINPEIKEPQQRGIDFARWHDVISPPVKIIDPVVYDCNTDGATVTNGQQCAYVLEMLSTDVANYTSTGKIELIRPRAYDSRATAKMLLPIYLNAQNVAQSIDRIYIEDPYAENWLSAANEFVNITKTLDGFIKFNKPSEKSFSSSSTLVAGQFSGQLLSASVNAVITLPSANDSIGLEYLFHNPDAVTLQVRPNAADEILTYGNGTGVDAVLRKDEAYIKIKSIGGNKWQTLEVAGEVAPLNTQPTVGQNGIRQNAGTPVSVLTPRYFGEMVLDTSASNYYIATGLANTNWKQIT